jgi:hypothetical protein
LAVSDPFPLAEEVRDWPLADPPTATVKTLTKDGANPLEVPCASGHRVNR